MGNNNWYIWYDCFSNEINIGDDVIVAMKDHGKIVMRSAVVIELTGETMTVTYNKWKAGKEVTRKKYITNYNICKNLDNIYKITK